MEEELRRLFIELIQFSKEVSPEVWAILIKQQIIEGIISMMACVILLPASVTLIWLTIKKWDWIYKKDWEIGSTFIAGVVTLGALIALTVFLAKGFPRLINPEYYALMALKP